jgi:hypothetical protein
VSGYEIINTMGTLPTNGTVSVVATCPLGKRVLGGGYVVPSEADTAPLSRPEADNAWRVDFKSNGGSGTASVFAYLRCGQLGQRLSCRTTPVRVCGVQLLAGW